MLTDFSHLSLTSRGLAHSVIWLHDGFWISPAPDFTLLQETTRCTLVHFGFQPDGVFLRAECLLSKYRDLLNEVANVRCPSPQFLLLCVKSK